MRWVCERINEGKSDKWIAENSTNPNLTVIQTKRIRYKIRYKFISTNIFKIKVQRLSRKEYTVSY